MKLNRLMMKMAVLSGALAGVLAGALDGVPALAANVADWDPAAANNNAAPPDGFPEDQAPSTVNDSARELMAAIARWYGDTNGSLVLGGTGAAYTLTTNSSYAALTELPPLIVEINADNTGAATLAVDGLAAKDIKLPDGSDPAAGALQDGAVVILIYENSADDFFLVAGASGAPTGTDAGEIPLLGAGGLDTAIHGAAVPVGTVFDYIGSAAPTGFLVLNGDDICPAAGSCDQSSDAYEDLYLLFWGSMADGQAAVAGGRGASAAADWAANKPLTMPDARGRQSIGAGAGAGLTARALGATGGEEEHLLTGAESGVAPHNHDLPARVSAESGASDANRVSGANTAGSTFTLDDMADAAAADAAEAHAVMDPWLALNKIVRY